MRKPTLKENILVCKGEILIMRAVFKERIAPIILRNTFSVAPSLIHHAIATASRPLELLWPLINNILPLHCDTVFDYKAVGTQ